MPAAWGAASEVTPKFVSRSDPASQWTAIHKGHAFFAYPNNYLIDLKASIIIDVEATRAIRRAEVGAAKTMIDRTEERFGLKPKRLAGDTNYGSAEILGWMVEEKAIEPHVALWEKGERTDGTISRSDFCFDAASDTDQCPGGRTLQQYRRPFKIPRTGVTKDNTRLYRASQRDCGACALKARCRPGQPHRKIPRSIREAAREVVRRLAGTPEYLRSRRERKRSRCCLPISSAFSDLTGCYCEGPAAHETSSCSPPLRRTDESSPNWPAGRLPMADRKQLLRAKGAKTLSSTKERQT